MHYTDIIEKGLNAVYAAIPCKKPSPDQARDVKFIAHRGAHDNANGLIENTLPAFKRAQELGCDGVELDVRLSRDGEFIVHHDETLQRIFGKPQRVSDLTVAELQEIAPAIPTLETVIEQFGGKQILFIEIKTLTGNALQRLVDLLKNLEPAKDFFLISLEEAILAEMKAFPKASLLLIPLHLNTAAFCRLCLEKDYGGVLGHYVLLTRHKIKGLQAAGKTVGVGFIDSENSLYRELQRNILWLFSNRAEKVLPFLQKLTENPENP